MADSLQQFQTFITPFADRAIKEMAFSGLPGRVNGPADAYRHLLWGAELTRALKSSGMSDSQAAFWAMQILDLHEQGNPDTFGVAMDRHNNQLATQIGVVSNSWEQTVTMARDAMTTASQSPNLTIPPDPSNPSSYSFPADPTSATWMPEAQWNRNPLFLGTNTEAQNSETNWPPVFPGNDSPFWDPISGQPLFEWDPATQSIVPPVSSGHHFPFDVSSTDFLDTDAAGVGELATLLSTQLWDQAGNVGDPGAYINAFSLGLGIFADSALVTSYSGANSITMTSGGIQFTVFTDGTWTKIDGFSITQSDGGTGTVIPNNQALDVDVIVLPELLSPRIRH
jgi:hypothetical protein